LIKSKKKRRQKKISSKEKSVPKKPLNAYMVFSLEERQRLKNDGYKGKAILSLIATKWSNLSLDEKKRYKEIAQADKELYLKYQKEELTKNTQTD
jgi:hypothetical protein